MPLDYDKPDGEQITLALVRRPADNPDQRVGSLLVNPGGPGGSGIDLAENKQFPKEIQQRMDVVGFDPRGVGKSSPLDCHSHLQEMYDADPTPATPAERAAYLKVSKAYVGECARKEKDVLPHLGTLNVARDMDRIREALGEKKLNYLGYSYGTSIGQMYAQLFPTRIRTMVLDGVVNTELTGLQGADEQADGFYQALQAYLADCKSDSSCVLGADPRGQLEKLVAAAEARADPGAPGRPAGDPGRGPARDRGRAVQQGLVAGAVPGHRRGPQGRRQPAGADGRQLPEPQARRQLRQRFRHLLRGQLPRQRLADVAGEGVRERQGDRARRTRWSARAWSTTTCAARCGRRRRSRCRS